MHVTKGRLLARQFKSSRNLYELRPLSSCISWNSTQTYIFMHSANMHVNLYVQWQVLKTFQSPKPTVQFDNYSRNSRNEYYNLNLSII